MESIKKDIALSDFDCHIYKTPPIFISCDKYWDGGIYAKDSLKSKAEFYTLSSIFSDIVKALIQTLDESPILGKSICDHQAMYAHFSNMESYELFREITDVIKRNKYYRLNLPEDNDIIDLIIESNFRYFTHIALFLPNSKIIVEPSCHTELLIYCPHKERINILDSIVAKYSSKQYRIKLIEQKQSVCSTTE